MTVIQINGDRFVSKTKWPVSEVQIAFSAADGAPSKYDTSVYRPGSPSAASSAPGFTVLTWTDARIEIEFSGRQTEYIAGVKLLPADRSSAIEKLFTPDVPAAPPNALEAVHYDPNSDILYALFKAGYAPNTPDEMWINGGTTKLTNYGGYFLGFGKYPPTGALDRAWIEVYGADAKVVEAAVTAIEVFDPNAATGKRIGTWTGSVPVEANGVTFNPTTDEITIVDSSGPFDPSTDMAVLWSGYTTEVSGLNFVRDSTTKVRLRNVSSYGIARIVEHLEIFSGSATAYPGVRVYTRDVKIDLSLSDRAAVAQVYSTAAGQITIDGVRFETAPTMPLGHVQVRNSANAVLTTYYEPDGPNAASNPAGATITWTDTQIVITDPANLSAKGFGYPNNNWNGGAEHSLFFTAENLNTLGPWYPHPYFIVA